MDMISFITFSCASTSLEDVTDGGGGGGGGRGGVCGDGGFKCDITCSNCVCISCIALSCVSNVARRLCITASLSIPTYIPQEVVLTIQIVRHDIPLAGGQSSVVSVFGVVGTSLLLCQRGGRRHR